MDMQLEEGEISDNSSENGICPYKPNERPIINYECSSLFQSESPTMEQDATSSNNLKQTTVLNSDSETDDERANLKRFKPSPPKKNKYSIWNKDPNGDLTDILNQCGMDEKCTPDMCRNVENYPLPPRKRKVPNCRRQSQEQQNIINIARKLDLLVVNESNTIEEVADDITKKLNEYNEELILRIVIILGKVKAIQLYEKTRVIESLGGMLICNGARKRTSGGVFIFLVRNDKELSDDKFKAIFEKETIDQKKLHKSIRKMKKKRKSKLKNNKSKEDASELSNPPPSPVLPELPLRRDLLTELADKKNDISELQNIVNDIVEDEDEGGAVSCDEMDSLELT